MAPGVASQVDAVGIDYYPPISDWRDGPDHADLAAGRSIYDVDYLRARLQATGGAEWGKAVIEALRDH